MFGPQAGDILRLGPEKAGLHVQIGLPVATHGNWPVRSWQYM